MTREARPFGDCGLLVATSTIDEAHALCEVVRDRRMAGVEEVLPGDGGITVVFDPEDADLEELRYHLATARVPAERRAARRRLEVPVSFDGPDMSEVAALSGVEEAEVVHMLTSVTLEVAFLGFAPGFAYMVGLPPSLARLERRVTPRQLVPKGSLAVAGGFAAIYPGSSPGGWHLVGRSNLTLFDPGHPPFALLRAGDEVQLRESISEMTVPSGPTSERAPLAGAATRALVVEDPGMLSLIEDAGRKGVGDLGVPRAGAADAASMVIANRLVGNEDGAAVMEITGRGPSLRTRSDTVLHVAMVGHADIDVDGLPVAANSVLPLSAGQVMRVKQVRHGMRSYIAVGGGFETPVLMGSRSSDVLSGTGLGPLRAQDVLAVGRPTLPRGRLTAEPPSFGPRVLRATVGPDRFGKSSVAQLARSTRRVGTRCNRVGAALEGPRVDAPSPPGSRGMLTGAVQVPPDGTPIVLLCDHATHGGYPVIATVIGADLGILGQLAPGVEVRIELVDHDEAAAARGLERRSIEKAVVGWYPVRTD